MTSKDMFSSQLLNEKSFLIVMLLLGCFLRVIWPEDMEWKADEKANYEIALAAASSGDWPKTGILNSQGIPNPPLSAWVFTLFAKGSSGPVGMVRWIQVLNVVSLFLFLWAFRGILKGAGTNLLLRGIALFSVSPMPVIYSRKIWQQCLLPSITSFLFLPFIFPRATWSFFVAGVFASFGVQIHQSGLFLYPLLFVAFVWHFKSTLRRRQTAAFLAGGFVGGLSLLPWLEVVFKDGIKRASSHYVMDLAFFDCLLKDTFGLGLRYLLQGRDWSAFLQFGSYSVLLLHIGLALLCVVTAVYFLIWLKDFGQTNRVWFLLATSIFLYGILLTALGFRFYPHYLIVTYPLLHLGVVAVLANRRWVANSIIVASLLVSAAFLLFIHKSGGSSSSEYGVVYRQQVKGN